MVNPGYEEQTKASKMKMLTPPCLCSLLRACLSPTTSDVEPHEGHELRGGPLPGQLHPRAVPHHRRHHAGGHREVARYRFDVVILMFWGGRLEQEKGSAKQC